MYFLLFDVFSCNFPSFSLRIPCHKQNYVKTLKTHKSRFPLWVLTMSRDLHARCCTSVGILSFLFSSLRALEGRSVNSKNPSRVRDQDESSFLSVTKQNEYPTKRVSMICPYGKSMIHTKKSNSAVFWRKLA